MIGRRHRLRLAVLSGAFAVLAMPATAQTTYIGGGQSGGQGGGDVIVNMDAIGGTRPTDTRRGGRDDDDVEAADRRLGFGEPMQGPGGALLRYPPKKPPRSRLTVELPADVAQRLPAAPRRKPASQATTTATATQTGRGQRDGEQKAQTQSQALASETPEKAIDAREKAPPAPAARPQAGGEVQTARREETRTPTRKPETGGDMATGGDKTSDSGATGATTTGTEGDGDEPPAPPKALEESPADDAGGGADGTEIAASTESAAEPAAETTTDEPGTAGDGGDSKSEAAEAEATGGEPAAGETQTAALPPAEEGLPERIRLMFSGGSADLSPDAKRTLAALAERMQADEDARIQLVAYAAAEEGRESRARRLSLSRALAVRSFLINEGVRSTRMDVRALGSTADNGPLNRIDIQPARR